MCPENNGAMGKENYTTLQHKASSDFERQYIDVRQKEQRVYTDEQLARLPLIDNGHFHYSEWKLRKRSADRFINYLKQKGKYLRVLEVGCGNGWLSARIAETEQADVTGIDVNKTELEQAARVFKRKNLSFLFGNIQNNVLDGYKFDIILFAASIQYFPCLTEIINTSFSLLAVGGEIHILDTNFYKAADIDAAAQRTEAYYTSIGFPEMNAYYFHHSMDELGTFNYEILFDPYKFTNRLMRKGGPFYWLSIKQ